MVFAVQHEPRWTVAGFLIRNPERNYFCTPPTHFKSAAASSFPSLPSHMILSHGQMKWPDLVQKLDTSVRLFPRKELTQGAAQASGAHSSPPSPPSLLLTSQGKGNKRWGRKGGHEVEPNTAEGYSPAEWEDCSATLQTNIFFLVNRGSNRRRKQQKVQVVDPHLPQPSASGTVTL